MAERFQAHFGEMTDSRVEHEAVPTARNSVCDAVRLAMRGRELA